MSAASDPPTAAARVSLGLAAARRWPETEALRRHETLLALRGERVAWLVADGVRELLANAATYGALTCEAAELVIDPAVAVVTLRIQGNEFDSVQAATSSANRWLHRFDRMLRSDGVSWSWRREQGMNVIEFRLTGLRPDRGGDA